MLNEQAAEELLEKRPWYQFFDALERVPLHLPDGKVKSYHNQMNALFADEGIAYRFELGRIVRRGTEEFREAVTEARHALNDERFQEVLRQFDRACEFRNQIPPDWANAIKEAANSVEGVLAGYI